MRKNNPYPPLYEANPVGPAITREDFIKTAASLRAVLTMVQLDLSMPDKDTREAFKQISRQLTAEIGRQWSFLTAMQYLTGQRADKAVHRWSGAFEQEGLTRPRIEALIAAANDFCANGIAGKTLSAGLMVSEYKRRPIEPQVMLELTELPPEVLDRVKAHLAASDARTDHADQ